MSRPEVPIHTGLSALADRYDAFILDLWGVLHDGVTPYPGAVDGLRRLRAAGKRLLVLSNAPRRAAHVAAQTAAIGIAPELYDDLWSSGEETWRCLKEGCDAWHRALGPACYHLGPERDEGMRDGLAYRFVDDPADADFVLNTGAHMPEATAEGLHPLLERAAERHLPMICANPDLVVIRGGRREICAGALARQYEDLGGEVRYHGKPHRPIYETCFARLGIGDTSGIAAVGDALATDIAGAFSAGIDGIFVAGGIHGDELGGGGAQFPDPERLATLCAAAAVYPTAALAAFRW
jgi:HAD superfamily hydrolase (TIGR01459 family)